MQFLQRNETWYGKIIDSFSKFRVNFLSLMTFISLSPASNTSHFVNWTLLPQCYWLLFIIFVCTTLCYVMWNWAMFFCSVRRIFFPGKFPIVFIFDFMKLRFNLNDIFKQNHTNSRTRESEREGIILLKFEPILYFNRWNEMIASEYLTKNILHICTL